MKSLFEPRRGIKKAVLNTDSSLFPQDTVCKICWEDASKENFIRSPCKCTGTQAFIHKTCLYKL